MTSTAKESIILEKLELSKACIHCGMCLPACPTYLETANEGHSPRGRIYLIRDYIEAEKANNNKESKLDDKSIEYLDNCLNCRACETACPSGVDYHSILEYARTDKGLSKYHRGLFGMFRKFAFKYFLPNRKLLSLFRIALHIINFVYKLIPALPKLSKIQPELKEPYREIKTDYIYKSKLELSSIEIETLYNNFSPLYADLSNTQASELRNSQIEELRTIKLPTGCVMDTIYNHVHWDTIQVLNELGFHVYIPPSACCGALASHSGEEQLGQEQVSLFFESILKDSTNSISPGPIVWNSAGCGAFTKDHAQNNFQGKIFDLIEIINMAPISLEDLIQKKSVSSQKPSKATYHPACHLNHAQGLKTEYLDILNLLPNTDIIPLYEADVCCGSAGFYNLIKSKMADDIGERKAKFIKDTGVHTVVTANPGCMSQIQAHLGPKFQTVHPISLLAQVLR